MGVLSVAAVVAAIREGRLLESLQLEELERQLGPAHSEPEALLRVLIERGWITSFQADRIVKGKAGELTIGRYVLLDRLGSGGMGQVFKARHPQMRRTVALKVIRKECFVQPDAVRRFQREIEAVARLTHPNIITAFDADEVGGVHFFVMEYVEGVDLARLVKSRGPLPIAEACHYARQAARGLDHAHQNGLVHRDIKPANIFLTHQGVIKILDLGLARLDGLGQSREGELLTEAGAMMGTPDYIAPEQAFDSHGADIRADIYSLGCTLYHLLAGRPPFPDGSLMQKLMKHQHEEPEELEDVRGDVPPPLADLVRTMMAKRPEDRQQKPSELVIGLKPFCQNSGAASSIRPAGPRSSAAQAESGETIPSTAMPPPPPRGDSTRRSSPSGARGSSGPGRQASQPVDGSPPSSAIGPASPPRPKVDERRSSGRWLLAVAGCVGTGVGTWFITSHSDVRQVVLRGEPATSPEPPRPVVAQPPAPDSSDAVARLKRAEAHLEAGRYAQAIPEFTEVIRLDPTSAPAHAGRALAHYYENDHDRAVADSDEAIRLDPRSARAYLHRAAAREETSRYREAIEDSTEAIRLDPGLGLAQAIRLEASSHTRDRTRSAEDRRAVERLDPRTPADYNYRSSSRDDPLERIADLDEAIRLAPRYATALVNRASAWLSRGDLDKALADLDEAVRVGPKVADAYLNRATVYQARGDLDRAIAESDEAIRVNPRCASAHTLRGRLSLARQDYDRALAECDEGLRLAPDDPLAREARAAVHFARGDLNRSLTDLSEAIRLDPESVQLWVDRGGIYFARREIDRAIADYSEAIRLGPKFPLAHNGRGNAYAQKGDVDRAIADYSEVIRLLPGSSLGFVNRADANAHKKDYARALIDYGRAIEVDPNNAFVRLGRGCLRAVMGDHVEALNDFGEALRLEPTFALAYVRRGESHIALMNDDEALNDSDEAIRLAPSLAQAYSVRATVHSRRGDAARTIADTTEALRLDPNQFWPYLLRSNAYSQLGNQARAASDYQAAVRLNPQAARISASGPGAMPGAPSPGDSPPSPGMGQAPGVNNGARPVAAPEPENSALPGSSAPPGPPEEG